LKILIAEEDKISRMLPLRLFTTLRKS